LNTENRNAKSENIHPSYDEFKKIKPSWTTSLRRGIEYLFFRFGLFLGKKFSLLRLQNFGRIFAKIAYLVLKKDRGIVEKQLKLIFPDLDETLRNKMTKECFEHFGQLLFEFLSLPQIIREEANLLQVENEEVIKKAVRANKGVILLAMHSGNWELISAYAKRSGIKMNATTANFPDPRINILIEKQRKHENMVILRRGTSKTIKNILQCLKNKEVLILAIDQDTNVLSTWIPFFGIPAKTPVAAAKFALKTGAHVVSYDSIRQKDGTFKIKFESLGIFLRKYQTLEQDLFSTLMIMNQHLEKRIFENPTQWAWFHRRWRHRPSENDLKKMSELQQNLKQKFSRKKQ